MNSLEAQRQGDVTGLELQAANPTSDEWFVIDGDDSREDKEILVLVGKNTGAMVLRVISIRREADVIERREWLEFPIKASDREDAKEHPLAFAASAGIKDLRTPFEIERAIQEREEYEKAA